MEAATKTNCPTCSVANRAEARFCASCGSKLQTPKDCSSCGKANSADARFCRHCGATTANENRQCPSCGMQNAQTAKFCKDCAAPLGPAIESREEKTDVPELTSGESLTASQNGFFDRTADNLSSETSSPAFSGAFDNFVASTKAILQQWYSEAENLAKERPYVAIGGAVAAVVLLSSLVVGLFWIHHSQASNITGSGATQANGESSGTLYATRFTHIRNAPTSIGTIVIGDVRGGEAVSGTWVLGRDGATRWLRIQRPDGSYGFIWGENLSPSVASAGIPNASINVMRDQSINISTGEINGEASDFTLMGWRQNGTGVEDQTMNLRSLNGGPDAVDSARGAVMGMTEPGYQGCSAASLSDDIIGISAMAPGTWFCLRGTNGRLAEMRLNSILNNPDGIDVSVTAWH
jgi:Double zinc ribbon